MNRTIKNVGDCALCHNSNVELMNSHLIPKLVYNRIKSRPNSRFRILDEINKPLQDGEKKYMLCAECERLFNKYETPFTNQFFDTYLKTQKILGKAIKQEWFFDYCLSVAWRILYDDLYCFRSHSDNMCRKTFELFEEKTSEYFNKQKLNQPCSKPNVVHYILKLNKLVSNNKIRKLFRPLLYGFSIYNAEYQIYLVYTYYAGLIIVTEFFPERIMYISSLMNIIKRKYFRKSIVKSIIIEDIFEQASLVVQQYNENMTEKLRIKINNRYEIL